MQVTRLRKGRIVVERDATLLQLSEVSFGERKVMDVSSESRTTCSSVLVRLNFRFLDTGYFDFPMFGHEI